MSAFADWESSPKAVIKEILTTAADAEDMKAIEDLEEERNMSDSNLLIEPLPPG